MITVDITRLDLLPGRTILDIGCGPGRHSCAAARFPGVTVIGADIDFDDLLEARSRLSFQEQVGECAGRWGLATADILQLPFGNEWFDILICAEVLEHIPDDDAAIVELIRVVRPGGTIAVSVPRFLPEKICWLLSKDYHRINRGHVRIYRKRQLIERLERRGLSVCDHHYAHGLHTPYWWLKCLVGPARQDHPLVRRYHQFLIWDLMKQPRFSQLLDRLLNPFLGKSLVVYCRK